MTATISYVIIGFSAIFGMYNGISYLYFAADRNLKTMLLNVIYEYLKGAVIGGAILEGAIVLVVISLAIWERNR